MAPSPNPEAEARRLLEGGFPQVILSGPPGTGKTRAALRVAAAILDKADVEALWVDSRFALVQFHPSYNYEDFVRGIRMRTNDNGQVVYQTENRVFADMARSAANSNKKHAIVIDEINRANVSAVLGELIYGLEYRSTEVTTPHPIDNDAGLVIPKNLLLLGTMNTADRTIGQIDYAVRRRFAFVHCPPSREVAQSRGANAVRFFDMTDAVFAHLSPDHDAEDVRIGHSYFLADGAELANKIIYQVVPMLREYVKDGVLLKEAEGQIRDIERKAKELMNQIPATVPAPVPASNKAASGNKTKGWYWTRIGKPEVRSEITGYGRMVLSLVLDARKRRSRSTLEALQADFPHGVGGIKYTTFPHFILELNDDVVQKNLKEAENGKPARFFFDDDDIIYFGNGTEAVLTNQLGVEGTLKTNFNNLRNRARKLGYAIRRAIVNPEIWIVNIGEDEGRDWEKNREFRFWSAGHGASWAYKAKRLGEGSIVFAYLNGHGYVGVGRVAEAAQPIGDFIVEGGKKHGKKLADCVDNDYLVENLWDLSKCEWAVRIDWLKDLDREAGIKNVPHLQGAVNQVTKESIISGLKKAFNVSGELD